MPLKKHNRQYDLILLGATGYTGALTAEEITKTLPVNLKWAVAGRSADKLEQLVSQCISVKPDGNKPSIEICSVDEEQIRALVRKTFCIITTLGPYAQYGEITFKACAEAGTHYLDCTGEVPFTHSMIKKYESAAKASGALMFPQSGLESAPSDVLTWALVSTIRSAFSSPTSDVIMSLHRLDSIPSGGTFASFMYMFKAFPAKALFQALEPYAFSPVSNDHPPPKKSLITSATGLVRNPGLGLLSTSATGAMNAAMVFRSWGLTKTEPSLQQEFYGPNFTYREFMKARNFVSGLAMHYGVLIGLVLLMCAPARAIMRKIVFKQGEGPNKENTKKDRIEFKAVAKPDLPSESRYAFGSLSYTGSMYYLTATLLAQGAATILQDDLKLGRGIYTPSCLGIGYLQRLRDSGVEVETEVKNGEN